MRGSARSLVSSAGPAGSCLPRPVRVADALAAAVGGGNHRAEAAAGVRARRGGDARSRRASQRNPAADRARLLPPEPAEHLYRSGHGHNARCRVQPGSAACRATAQLSRRPLLPRHADKTGRQVPRAQLLSVRGEGTKVTPRVSGRTSHGFEITTLGLKPTAAKLVYLEHQIGSGYHRNAPVAQRKRPAP